MAWPLDLPGAPAAGPVPDEGRIESLDVLRGVAVMGILLVNISFFAFPFSKIDQLRWWELGRLDAAVCLFVELFCTFKFISLFSLLFGMGLALQSGRADATGRSFGGIYSRRLAVLFVLGVLHGTLLWYGDILSTYALLGFVALALRRLRDRTLLRVAAILFLVPVLLLAVCTLIDSGNAEAPASWSDYMAPHLSDESMSADFRTSLADFARFMDDEVRIYQYGPVVDQILHRSVSFAFVFMLLSLLLLGWRCLALFLLGIWLIRRGVLQRPNEHRRLLNVFMLALPAGLFIEIVGELVRYGETQRASTEMLYVICLYLGSLGMTLGYFAIIVRLCQRGIALALLHRIAALGRMALSNYIGHSVLCGLVFYSYGLGWFNRISHSTAALIAVGVLLVQLAISPVWLRHFRFGPLEWLWRTLTYLKPQPMRRASSAQLEHPLRSE